MKNPRIEDWFCSDHDRHEFPPGLWAAAGQFKNKLGVYIGTERGIETFIPEAHLAENIPHLQAQGETGRMLAETIINLLPDIEDLRAGRQQIYRKLCREDIAP